MYGTDGSTWCDGDWACLPAGFERDGCFQGSSFLFSKNIQDSSQGGSGSSGVNYYQGMNGFSQAWYIEYWNHKYNSPIGDWYFWNWSSGDAVQQAYCETQEVYTDWLGLDTLNPTCIHDNPPNAPNNIDWRYKRRIKRVRLVQIKDTFNTFDNASNPVGQNMGWNGLWGTTSSNCTDPHNQLPNSVTNFNCFTWDGLGDWWPEPDDVYAEGTPIVEWDHTFTPEEIIAEIRNCFKVVGSIAMDVNADGVDIELPNGSNSFIEKVQIPLLNGLRGFLYKAGDDWTTVTGGCTMGTGGNWPQGQIGSLNIDGSGAGAGGNVAYGEVQLQRVKLSRVRILKPDNHVKILIGW